MYYVRKSVCLLHSLFILVTLMFVSSCSIADSAISQDKTAAEPDGTSSMESSVDSTVEEAGIPAEDEWLIEANSSFDSYPEPAIKTYYVGDCSSDGEALEKLEAILQSEEELQSSGYAEIPIFRNFYAVLNTERDDSILMEKIQNNEVYLTKYSNVRLNGRKVHVTIIRYP